MALLMQWLSSTHSIVRRCGTQQFAERVRTRIAAAAPLLLAAQGNKERRRP